MKLPVILVLCILLGAFGCRRVSKEDKLVAAARNNDVGVVKLMLKRGANIDRAENGMLSQTALIASVSAYQTNAFYLLLANGANVNCAMADGTTPLMEAVSVGDANLARVKALIQKGADVNAIDNSNNSVMSHARAAGCSQIIQELVLAGAKE
jgi:ankyrin repeat protein